MPMCSRRRGSSRQFRQFAAVRGSFGWEICVGWKIISTEKSLNGDDLFEAGDLTWSAAENFGKTRRAAVRHDNQPASLICFEISTCVELAANGASRELRSLGG
jgi:hypothetical protein